MTQKNGCVYKILPLVNLVLQIHNGDNDYRDFKYIKQNIINDKEFNHEFNFIIDVRDSHIKMTTDEFIKYTKLVIKLHAPINPIKIAVLTASPEHVAFVILFELNECNNLLKYKAFSTLHHSLLWLYGEEFENDYILEAIILNEKKYIQ